MMNTQNFLVDVRCFTFNQSGYITDTMNGFCMQKTNFPFICCIVDDASTDGEQEVIEKYLEDNFDLSKESGFYKEETDYGYITYARHKTNENCFFYVILLKENHYSNPEIKEKRMSYISHWQCLCKYEAMCEGDDYWIDSSKLQKQTDFLENNSDYIMCFTNFNMYYQNSDKMYQSVLINQPEKYPHEFSIGQWIMAKAYVGPMSWMYKTSCIYEIPELGGPDGTFVWFAYFLATSKVKCLIDKTTAVYRINDGSVTHLKRVSDIYKRTVGLFKIQLRLIELYISDYEQGEFKERLYLDYASQNMKYIYLCNDKFGLSIIDIVKDNFPFRKKVLYYAYQLIPNIMSCLYSQYLKSKGILNY